LVFAWASVQIGTITFLSGLAVSPSGALARNVDGVETELLKVDKAGV
jgi:hypothetical protein